MALSIQFQRMMEDHFIKTTMFFLCFLTPIPISLGQTCDNNPHINGCSIPFNLSLPFRTTFTPACNRHDICYRCGKQLGFSRLRCDEDFFDNMNKTCSQSPQGFECTETAFLYYAATRIGGSDRFRQESLPWCRES